MRFLIPLVVVCMVLLAVTPAVAESYREEGLPAFVPDPQDPLQVPRGIAVLQLSPMFLEIHGINEASVAVENALLAELAAATDEAEVERLVLRLAALDIDRQLSVLKVRIRYARLEGRFDEAFRLRQEMLQLLQNGNGPPM
ncbi:hypothetical protein KDM41_07800 [bacterium]|nr:hypothetical protein [bacterium]